MPHIAVQLPVRSPGLVCSRVGENGRFLIRNRQTGESFQLGEEEHFLLERLDGHQTADEICRAFADRFGEPLADEELDDFIEMAVARGLLQHDSPEAEAGIIDPGPLQQGEGTPVHAVSKPPWRARWMIRLLKGVSAALQWLVWLPNLTGRRIQERIRHLEFVPRPDDVFIATYPRSGTTWLQMILYQLTTDGSMDFPHIAEYCPWFERSLRARRAFETRPSPRLFKSHLPYHKIPGNDVPRQSLGTRPKYIYVARNGKDVAVSYYHLNRKYNSYEGTFAAFFNWFLTGKTPFGCWFEHVEGWWAHRDDPNVLFVTYEELSRDLEGCIRRIADFIGREVPPERMPGIVERCRFAFMKQHEHKFDPAMESLWEQGVKLKSFLRRGRTGDAAVCLTDEQQARFDDAFAKRLGHLGIPLS